MRSVRMADKRVDQEVVPLLEAIARDHGDDDGARRAGPGRTFRKPARVESVEVDGGRDHEADVGAIAEPLVMIACGLGHIDDPIRHAMRQALAQPVDEARASLGNRFAEMGRVDRPDDAAATSWQREAREVGVIHPAVDDVGVESGGDRPQVTNHFERRLPARARGADDQRRIDAEEVRCRDERGDAMLDALRRRLHEVGEHRLCAALIEQRNEMEHPRGARGPPRAGRGSLVATHTRQRGSPKNFETGERLAHSPAS